MNVAQAPPLCPSSTYIWRPQRELLLHGKEEDAQRGSEDPAWLGAEETLELTGVRQKGLNQRSRCHTGVACHSVLYTVSSLVGLKI